MWPRFIANTKLLSKTLSSNNFVANVPASPESFPHLQKSDILLESKKTENYNIFVSTWNVGGVAPAEDMNIDDLLDTDNTFCDIYVFGFQEVVPLYVSNVLGLHNKKVSTKWNSLIKKALSKKSSSDSQHEFHCLVSKRMVGLLITIWVRRDLLPHLRSPSVSRIGCGFMGCLGNKGSVSVRFQLYETSFCFVCSHLESGGGEGDELKRNSNAAKILSRTTFSTIKGSSVNLPKSILNHDRVVLFGDLNYRISLPEKETRLLARKKDWNTLLEYDQLRTELMNGQFGIWQEGAIDFTPTYKYFPNSDEYFDKKYETKRAPAWCDRIIWTGEGLKQILYARSEYQLSDHRPVKAIFSTQVKV